MAGRRSALAPAPPLSGLFPLRLVLLLQFFCCEPTFFGWFPPPAPMRVACDKHLDIKGESYCTNLAREYCVNGEGLGFFFFLR